MSLSKQMASLAQHIEASHEARRVAISAIVEETHQTLGNFNRERAKIAHEQKHSLASNRSDRTRQVEKMCDENEKEVNEIAVSTADFLSSSEHSRRQTFAHLMGNIQRDVATIEEDTARTLADFNNSHKEMAGALKARLAHDARARNDAVHNLQARFTEEHKELTRETQELAQQAHALLADLSVEPRQSHTYWQNLTETMTVRRKRKAETGK